MPAKLQEFIQPTVGRFSFQESIFLCLKLQDAFLELLVLGCKTPKSAVPLWQIPEFDNHGLSPYLKRTHESQEQGTNGIRSQAAFGGGDENVKGKKKAKEGA